MDSTSFAGMINRSRAVIEHDLFRVKPDLTRGTRRDVLERNVVAAEDDFIKGKRSPQRIGDSPQSHEGHKGKSPILLGDLCAFAQEETGGEKSQRNQSSYSVAFGSYLAAPVSLEERSR